MKTHFNRNLFLNLTVSIISLTFFVLLGEITLRILGKGEWIVRNEPDKKIIWKMKPNQKFFNGHEVIINSKGLRDNEFSVKKADDLYRILVLGDSVTFAKEVKLEDVYTEKLESILNQNALYSYVNRFEVINTGVNGYNTHQELIYLKETGIKYQPDLVIVGFVMNDLDLACKPLEYKLTKAILLKMQHSVFYSVLKGSIHNLLSFLKQSRVSHKDSLGRKDVDLEKEFEINFKKQFIDEPYGVSEKKWIALENQLKEIKNIVDKNSCRMLLAIIPYRPQVEKGEKPNVQERLKNFCLINKIPFVDLLPTFKNSKGPFFISATHLNEKGHLIIAKELYRNIINKNFAFEG